MIVLGGWTEFSIGAALISTLLVWNWMTSEPKPVEVLIEQVNVLETALKQQKIEVEIQSEEVGIITRSLESLDAQQQGTVDYLIEQRVEIETQFEELALEVSK